MEQSPFDNNPHPKPKEVDEALREGAITPEEFNNIHEVEAYVGKNKKGEVINKHEIHIDAINAKLSTIAIKGFSEYLKSFFKLQYPPKKEE